MTESRPLHLVLALFALLGIGYSLLIPMWEAQDESSHYLLSLHFARTGHRAPRDYNAEADQPPLYYWLASWPLRALGRIDPSYVDHYAPDPRPFPQVPKYGWNSQNYRFLLGAHLLRWLNVLLGSVTLGFVYAAARRIAPQPETLPATATGLAAFTPHFLLTTASISNAALANLAGAFLFWLLARLCTQRIGRAELALCAVAAVFLPLLTKMTVLPMGLAVLAAIAWRTRAHRLLRWRKALVGAVLAAAILAVAVTTLAPRSAHRLWHHMAWRATFVREGAVAALPGAARWFAFSYWGSVGWSTVFLPAIVLKSMTALAGLGALASVRLALPERVVAAYRSQPIWMLAFIPVVALGAWLNSWLSVAWTVVLIWAMDRSLRRTEATRFGSPTTWLVVWIAVALGAAAVTKNFLASPMNQARHLFPEIGPLSLLIASGWSVLLPPQARASLLPLTLLGMVLLNLILVFDTILPVFHQPFLD